jgi:hypothetical protein
MLKNAIACSIWALNIRDSCSYMSMNDGCPCLFCLHTGRNPAKPIVLPEITNGFHGRDRELGFAGMDQRIDLICFLTYSSLSQAFSVTFLAMKSPLDKYFKT